MRFLTFTLSFLLMLAAHPAMSGTVLLPDDDNSGSTPVNLGLLPTVASPIAPSSPTTPTPPRSYNLQNMPQDPSALAKIQETILKQWGGRVENIKSTSDVQEIISRLTPEQRKMFQANTNINVVAKGPVTITPGGHVAPEAKTEEQLATEKILGKEATLQSRPKSNMMVFAEEVRKKIEEQRKGKPRPPLFLNELEPDDLDESAYTSALSVSVAPAYLWGENDVRLLERTLGYNAKTIPQNCQIRLDATVKTSDASAPYSKQIFSGQQKAIKYNGAFQQASFKARAICFPPKELPENAGIITRSGDKYSILLMGDPSCAPEKKSTYATVGALSVQYVGNGNVTCHFQ